MNAYLITYPRLDDTNAAFALLCEEEKGTRPVGIDPNGNGYVVSLPRPLTPEEQTTLCAVPYR